MQRYIFSFICLLLPILAEANIPSLRIDSILPEDSVQTDTIADCTDTSKPLPQRIQELLDNDIFDRTQVGIYVYDLTADTLVFTHNEQQCMRPASNENS